MARVRIIKTSGEDESTDVPLRGNALLQWIHKMIGASCVDTVTLEDGVVMLVDDTGAVDGRPDNPKATKLYHAVCVAGTTHRICGDVAICLDSEFAET